MFSMNMDHCHYRPSYQPAERSPSPFHLLFDPRYFLVTKSLEPSKISPSTWHIFTQATERCQADLTVSMHKLWYSDHKKLEHSLALKCNLLTKMTSHYQQNNNQWPKLKVLQALLHSSGSCCFSRLGSTDFTYGNTWNFHKIMKLLNELKDSEC